MQISDSRAAKFEGARPLRFTKYSSHGNHFVLVDEIAQAPLSEEAKVSFAARAADPCAGVGADSVLFLQRCDADTLGTIQNARRYWNRGSDFDLRRAQIIARFFEPNGDEFLTCADGLMCIGHHLFWQHGLAAADILIEIPSKEPRLCSVEYARETDKVTLCLRPEPSRVSDFVLGQFACFRDADVIFFVGYSIGTQYVPITLSGVVLYTGEPHMVCFERATCAPPCEWPAHLPWAMNCPDIFTVSTAWGQEDILRRIGMHANREMPDCFPYGINVSIARLLEDPASIEYRCFERGLCRETLACGTGALAVSIAALRLGLIGGRTSRLLPHLGRKHPRYRHAEIIIDHRGLGHHVLVSEAEYVFSGEMSR